MLQSQLRRSASARRAASTLALYTWGGGGAGALGHGTLKSEALPTRVQALDEALAAAGGAATVNCGLFHTSVCSGNGDAYIWGRGSGGRLAAGDEETSAKPIALRVPPSTGGEPAAGGVKSLSLGGLHTCVLTTGGQLLTAGWGGWGALGLGDSGVRTTLSPVTMPRAVSAVSAGGAHTVVLLDDGEAWCFGRDEGEGRLGGAAEPGEASLTTPKQFPTPTGMRRFSHVAAGGFFTLLADEKTVLACGGNRNGECGRSSAAWGLGPVEGLPSDSPLLQLAAGGYHAAALYADGSLHTWGVLLGGALGHGGVGGKGVPCRVPGLPPLARVACGATSTWAVGQDGSLWGWGKSVARFGGTSENVERPMRIELPEGVRAVDVAAGAAHAAALCTQQ